MKKRLFISSWLMLVLALSAGTALAQTNDPPVAAHISVDTTNLLNQAVSFYQKGNYTNAINLLTGISQGDSNYGSAREWYALSLYALGNKAQSLAVANSLSPNLRADLDVNLFKWVYAHKKFAALLHLLNDYLADPPSSNSLPLVTEYQMAALYELGIKKVFAAAALPPGNAFNQLYAEGQTNLQDFLILAVARGESDYLLLPDRVLTEEMWVARAALGLDEDFADEDLPTILQALSDPQIREALLPDTVQADIEIKQDEKLLRLRRFDNLLPTLADFAERHPDSRQLWTAAEYQMAALYEHGIARLRDAAISQGSSATNRLTEGQANLTEFLNLAVAMNETNYVSLPERKLPDDIVQAQTALGNEASVMQSLSGADKEGAMFRSLELHCKLQPQTADENLARMTNFLNQFPNTNYRPRVQYDMGNVALEEGWRLTYEERKSDQAAPYLVQARGLLISVAEDEQAGIAAADVQESQVGILRTYYAQRDWASVSSWAAQMITNSPAGEREWLAAKLYDACGLSWQKKFSAAASELDEVLATGFKGNPSYDGLLVSAATWRIKVARQMGDGTTAQQVAQAVQSSACVGSLKRTFVNQFKTLLTQASPATNNIHL